MLKALEGLVAELREVGMNISTTEMIDASRALRELPLEDREIVKAALSTVLVKQFEHLTAYETIFDIYFAPRRDPRPFEDEDDQPRGNRLSDMSDEELKQRMQDAVENGDETMMRKLAALAVDRHAQIESGRAVAGVFYRMRTLRALDLKNMREQILANEEQMDDDAPADNSPIPRLDRDLEKRLREEEIDMRLAELQKEVEADIRRRLVEDRGAEAVAKTLKSPLPEDAEFLHASNVQIAEMRETLGPLTAKLASALAEKRRHKRQGALDFRRTVRSSMSNGGVPLDLYFRKPKPTKPDLVVLADISGSVARFAAFTLQLLYALRGEFSKLRSFVFADGIDEVTELMATARDISELTATINERGLGVWLNGSSDYGHALTKFHEEHLESIGSRSTVIVLGDARNNDKAAHLDDFQKIAKQAKHMYWLNPEPRKDWDTGDSILSRYGQHCEGVFECRNLRQLREFVEKLD
ncbi:MAG: VWA domain-containing protein [Frankiaceae bacterium]|jgi:uncharacterized protein with von Willebrand factor type A (vWA) domain|nr:VWA domain-containing protein [Frankiaceae bacterium]